MNQVAIFVDAGYLLAEGAKAVSGSEHSRKNINIDPGIVAQDLERLARELTPDCRLLRIYWYDGSDRDWQNPEHNGIAALDNVKLRLGYLNDQRRQKAVDSLIIADMIELTRISSISDALLLAGDGDLIPGVQVAQRFGVRVHLLGIQSDTNSLSQQLLETVDTKSQWVKNDIERFLSIADVEEPAPGSAENPAQTTAADESAAISGVVSDVLRGLDQEQVKAIQTYWNSGERGIPEDYDAKLLRTCNYALGRGLDEAERRQMRREFREGVEKRLAELS